MMEDLTAFLYAAVVIVLGTSFVRWRLSPDMPTLGGPSLPLLSYLGAVNILFRGKTIVNKGYRKYFGVPFKIPFLSGWVVVVTSPDGIEDIRTRPPSELSLAEGFSEIFPTQNSINHPAWDEHWEVDIIRGKLTRSIGAVIPQVCDELPTALSAAIPSDGTSDWVTVSAMQTAEKLVVRAASRAFIGLPICRKPEYLDLIVRFTHSVANSWILTQCFPMISGPPLRLGPYLSGVPKTMDAVIELVKPEIHQRRKKLEQLGEDWEDKPDDMLQWCIEEAIAKGYADESIVLRILSTNFAALHTSTLSLTHALYDLAAHPECLEPLREEVETVVASDGWTKAGLNKMWKVDSFLKESHRWNGLTFMSVFRKAMIDVTLRDGTKIPRGTYLAASAVSIHHDEEKYAGTDVFDPFRFAHMREQDDQNSTSHQFSNTSVNWLAFGHGRNACPGRFFASGVLKTILAHLVLNYDIKLVEEGKRPANFFFFMTVMPNAYGKVMLRKRQHDVKA
ncbi:cytochrome P450 [Earliella scabrosa]|nr:cytochrome P450 [Earliella scabrosa]